MPSLKHGLAIVGMSIAAGITGCHGSCCHQQEVCCDECENDGYYSAPYSTYPSYGTPVMPSQPVLQPTPTTPPPAPAISPGTVPPPPNLPSTANYPTTSGQQSWTTNGATQFNEPEKYSSEEQPNVFQKVRHSMKRAFSKVIGRGAQQIEYIDYGQMKPQPASEPLPYTADQSPATSPRSLPQQQPVRELDTTTGRSALLPAPAYSANPYSGTPYLQSGF